MRKLRLDHPDFENLRQALRHPSRDGKRSRSRDACQNTIGGSQRADNNESRDRDRPHLRSGCLGVSCRRRPDARCRTNSTTPPVIPAPPSDAQRWRCRRRKRQSSCVAFFFTAMPRPAAREWRRRPATARQVRSMATKRSRPSAASSASAIRNAGIHVSRCHGVWGRSGRSPASGTGARSRRCFIHNRTRAARIGAQAPPLGRRCFRCRRAGRAADRGSEQRGGAACAASWTCSPRRSSQSIAASSRRSTTGKRTSRPTRSSAGHARRCERSSRDAMPAQQNWRWHRPRRLMTWP